jgi:hypothetical protein
MEEAGGQLQQHSVSACGATQTVSFYKNKGHENGNNNINLFMFYKFCTYFTKNFSFLNIYPIYLSSVFMSAT